MIMSAVNDFIEHQLSLWPEVAERYHNLGKTERRRFKLGDFQGCFQFNPARIVSTGSKTDSKSIAGRPCFLCRENRPEQQTAIPLTRDWELLLNPFPIFPVHFTIASTRHIPQDRVPIEIGAIAERFPELAIFFNGSRAGASAPDHLHLQAVLKDELPIIRLVEKHHPDSAPGIMRSDMYEADLPFIFLSAVITDDDEGGEDYMKMLALTGGDPETGLPDKGLRNVIVWKGESGLLRMVVIPRKAHRPACYGTGENDLMVSPGTIDMAGVVILPREDDFRRITEDDLRNIYKDTAII